MKKLKIPVDGVGCGVVNQGHARRKHDGAKQLAVLLFRRISEPECVSTSASNPGSSHELPGLFPQYPHGEASHTVAETSAASPRRSLRLGVREDGRLPAQRTGKVQRNSNTLSLTFSLSFSLSGDNSLLRRPGLCRTVFLGESFSFSAFFRFYYEVPSH